MCHHHRANATAQGWPFRKLRDAVRRHEQRRRIDLIETEPVSGTTIVPFIDDPVSMQVAEGKYPKASALGTYDYRTTVSLAALEAAFGKAFDGSKLDLDRRVVLIHGVGATVTLPASVTSLGTIPSQVTLPIACGTIERQR